MRPFPMRVLQNMRPFFMRSFIYGCFKICDLMILIFPQIRCWKSESWKSVYAGASEYATYFMRVLLNMRPFCFWICSRITKIGAGFTKNYTVYTGVSKYATCLFLNMRPFWKILVVIWSDYRSQKIGNGRIFRSTRIK